MPRDYSNIPAAIRDEQLESLRESLANATTNAATHRRQAEHYQSAADRERHFAERDEERARQWKRQLDFAEGVTFKLEDQVVVSDPASPNHGTYGTVSGTGESYGYAQVDVEFHRDGTTHKFDASQLVLVSKAARDAESEVAL